MAETGEMKYTRVVIIFREGELGVVPFEKGREQEAEEFFDKASLNWSGSFLCEVIKGLIVCEFIKDP